MTSKIKTYKDLVEHEEKLEQLLKAQKELLVYDFNQLKEELKPAKAALSMVSRFTTREKGNFVLTQGANKVIDLVVKKFILARAGWLTRLAVPFFIKNVSSHIIAEKKPDIFKKLFSWIGHKNGHAKAPPENFEERTEPLK